jgi:hypothetical protein
VAALSAFGVPALGMCGSDGWVVAKKRAPVADEDAPEPVDYGWVGDVESVNPAPVVMAAQAGFVPVIACLATDGAGKVLNVNADSVAAKIAEALAARDLVFMTDVNGILRDLTENAVGVVELGDGLLGHHGGIQFFLDPELREQLRACVLCANDWVGVYGAREILRVFGVRKFIVTGMVAESAVGSPLLRLPFCNIRTNPEPLLDWVRQRLCSPYLPLREGLKWRLSTASAS